MKILHTCFFILVFSLFTPTIEANNIFGAGARSCGEMIADNDGPNQDFQTVGWISGYISALNVKNGTTKGAGARYESIYYAVKNRCEEKPLGLIADAIMHVYLYEL